MQLPVRLFPTGYNKLVKEVVLYWSVWAISLLFFLASIPAWSQVATASMPFPQYNSSYIAGSTLSVQNTITTPANTTITNVDLYYDTNFFSANIDSPTTGTLLVGNLQPPYTYDWTPPTPTTPSRSYFIRAVVTNINASGVSSTTFTNGNVKYIAISVYRPDYSTAPRKIYVSPGGSNASPYNSLATAATTLQRAADIVAPGDTVFVGAGTYATTSLNVMLVQRTGLPNKWITFKPYGTDKPVIQMGTNNFTAINLLPASAYVKVQGFEVIGNNANITLAQARAQVGACEGSNPSGTPIARFNGNGIAASGSNGGNFRPHHIIFSSNKVHDCAGGGFSVIQSDYVTVEDNLSYNNSWYTVYGTSGISIFNSWNFDNSTDTKMIVRRNRCYGNELKIAWNIGGTGTNCKFYDGNGIILDNNNAAKNPLGAYTGKILIENNLCYLNGGRGINVNYSDNASVINNTTYRNGVTNQTTYNSVVYAGIESEFISQFATGLMVYNNIFSGRPGEKTIEVNGSAISHNNNLTFDGTGTSYFTGNQNITGQDPLFINAVSSDFKLQPGSPAISAGSSTAGQFASTDIDGVNRPVGPGVDIGAFEIASALPVTISQFTAKPLGNQVSVAWSTAIETNSAYFEVERSVDVLEFKRIGRIDAAGESQTSQHYGLLDEKPLAGTNYYRLKQIDRDGATAYSKVVAVTMDNVQPSMELLGNPTDGNTIRIVTRNLDRAVFQLSTTSGQPIGLLAQPQADGEQLLLPLQPLPTGMYLLNAKVDGIQLTRKVLIR